MAEPRRMDARLSVAEDRLEAHGAEIQRLRERMHLLEGDRSAIRLAAGELGRLRKEIPDIAHYAADRAVAMALEERDEQDRERREEGRSIFNARVAFSGVLLSALSVAITLLVVLH